VLLLASSRAQEGGEVAEEAEVAPELTGSAEEEVQPRFLSSLFGNLAQKHLKWNGQYFVAPLTPLVNYPPPYEGYDTFPAYARPLSSYRPPPGGSYRPYVAVSKPYFFSRVRRPVYMYQPAVKPAWPVAPVQVDDVVIEPINE